MQWWRVSILQHNFFYFIIHQVTLAQISDGLGIILKHIIMENSKPLMIGLGVLVLLVLGYAGYRAMQQRAADTTPESVATTTPTEQLQLTVNTKHFYDGTTHWYHGVTETPTPCYDVSATATTNDSGASYDIVITTKDRGEVCAQFITSKEFDVQFTGHPYRVGAVLDGKPAQLNIIEVNSKEELQGPFDFKS